MKNRISIILLALIMILVFTVNASAEEESAIMPDLTDKGSLTLTMEVDGKLLDSGSLNLYRVADVSLVENRYDFRLLDTLAAVGAVLDTEDLYDGAQAQNLLEKAKETLELYSSSSIKNGKVSFADLETGLYLVWQHPEDASDGYDAISPFLISVPKLQNGAYTLHVDAKPKVPFVTTPPPPEETPPPPPPNLPQTGQLNWPVSVMGASGTVLLILGLILCVGGKKGYREK